MNAPAPELKTEAPPTRVRVSLHGDTDATFRPEYMGDAEDRYALYQSAIAGARFDRALRANVAILIKVPAILRRLRESRAFEVTVDDALRDTLQAGYHADKWLDLKEVAARVEHIHEQIKERQRKRGEAPKGMRPYQIPAAQWLALRTSGLLADDPRTGKTITTLVALPARAGAVVVCPTAPKHEWLAEIQRWRPNYSGVLLEGKTSFRWPREGEILILNYDILPDIHDRLGKKGRRCHGFLPPKPCTGCRTRTIVDAFGTRRLTDGHLPKCEGFAKPEVCPGCAPFLDEVPDRVVFILDEAHMVKHTDSLRGQRCKAMSASIRKKRGRCWLLTGTPLENRPLELYNLFDLAGMADECFGSFFDFVRLAGGRYKGKGRGFAWEDPPLPELKDRIRRGMLRRTREEIWPHLPRKVHRTIEVPVSREAVKACDEFLAASHLTAEKIAKLIEAEEDQVQIGGLSKVMTALAAAKIPAMMDRVQAHEDADEQILVFSTHRAPIDALAERPGWGVITGDVKDKKAVADEFQAGKLLGLGVVISAGGTGIRLDKAVEVLCVDRDYRPTVMVQAEDRAIGFDDKMGLVCTSLVAAHALDKRVTEILLQKQLLITSTVDAAREVGGGAMGSIEGASELEAELRAEGEAIAGGKPARRPPMSRDEDAALEAVRAAAFLHPSDERLALSLTQEAERRGLSDAQWRLMGKLSGRERRA